MRIHSEYSFRHAYGKIQNVHKRVLELGWPGAPLSDRLSTFGYATWDTLCEKANIKPIFGVEIGISNETAKKKTTVSWFTFFAKNRLRPLHDLIYQATSKFGYPSLTYEELKFDEMIIIADNKVDLSRVNPHSNFYIALSPSIPIGLFREAKKLGFQFMPSSDNVYTYPEDKMPYFVMLNLKAETAPTPQHILTNAEWKKNLPYCVTDDDTELALFNLNEAMHSCNAKLLKTDVFKPKETFSLKQMCIEGALKLKVDLTNNVYAERMERELKLIHDKQFEDYFYIVADLVNFAKTKMIVGPARGSAAGSLICYLIGITTVDPIKFGCLFERFIDVTRTDLPDIDLDFSDRKRDMVFEYLTNKYHKEHVAHLGSVLTYRPKSILNTAGISLGIPKKLCEAVAETLIERSSADSRAVQTFEETFSATEIGKHLLKEYPEISYVFDVEDHATVSGTHAAGIAITQGEVLDYVAIDARNGTIMADKKDAEKLNILKIDILGLSQLSVFERCLELIGKEPRNGFLETLPLDDQAAFDVLNKKQFSGIFQANGKSLQILFQMIHTDRIDDLVAVTALSRPGPVGTGGAVRWTRRRAGNEVPTYRHPLLIPFLESTYGEVVYQEQVMCLSEDTVIELWAVFDKYMTIKNLYKKCQLYPILYNKVKYHPALISLDEKLNSGIMQRASKVIQSGIKDCWKFIFSEDDLFNKTNDYVICTLDHKFIINGEWKRCGDSIIGDIWSTLYKEKIQVKRSFGAQTKVIKEAVIFFREKMEGYSCEDCGESYEFSKMHSHHNDLNEGKTNPYDLSWLCASCHTKRHNDRQKGKNWKNPEKLSYKKLLRIEHVGERMCYDIVMPIHHNFKLANGLITHNSICRDIGKMGFAEVSKIRKAMSKSMGAEEIKSYGKNFIKGAIESGIPDDIVDTIWGELVRFGSYGFNLSHAVSYGLITYYCCWLKAHYPIEFAAATLDSESDPMKQLFLLRELAVEGISYKAIDPDYSTDKWTIRKNEDGSKTLVGPLQNIKGIGPITVQKVIEARKIGARLTPSVRAKLDSAITKIDSLTPIKDAIHKLHPDLTKINIFSKPTPIHLLQCGMTDKYLILALVKRIQPRDLNDLQAINKRGYKLNGQSWVLRLFVHDDTDEILCQIDRHDYLTIGKRIEEIGGQGDVLYAIKGFIPETFRMLKVTNIRYLGKMSDTEKPKIKIDLFPVAEKPTPYVLSQPIGWKED